MVVLSAVPWYPQPARIQQIVSRLPQTRVLYFDPPPQERPKKKKAGGAEGEQSDAILQAGEFITILPLPAVPPGETRRAFRRQGRKLARFIRRAMAKYEFQEDSVIWCCAPAAADILPHIPHGPVIYDASYDNMLRDAGSGLLKALERELCARADLILVPAEEKKAALDAASRPVRLLPGGANFNLFSTAGKEDLPFPDELFAVKNPIIGYIGGIDAGTDLTYIEAAARLHPEWSFVLVGPVSETADAKPVENLPNVHMLGFRPHKLLPRYLSRFDVCVNPARYREDSASPLKLYEYLATGKPIVSTPHPRQVLDYTEVIYIAGTHNEFTDCCAKAILERDAWRKRQRVAYGKAASWDARVQELLRILTEAGI